MKKILITVIILGVVGAAIGLYLYNKPVADISDLKPDVKITASELFEKYSSDEMEANNSFLGKIVEVTGTVREISSDQEGKTIILETGDMLAGINCGMSETSNSTIEKYKTGDNVTIRGECTGMVMDVVMVRCVIIEN